MLYSIGLSIGQLSDRAAASVVRRDGDVYEVLHLHVWQPGTSHPTTIIDLKTILSTPLLCSRDASVTLAIDVTLAGIVTGHMYRDRLSVYTVCYDIAHQEREGALSKREIISMIRILLEERRLRYAPTMEHALTLQTELQQFQAKQVTGDNPMTDWRTRPHDDLVIATAMACWALQHTNPKILLWGD
jgi:hypothetical protein